MFLRKVKLFILCFLVIIAFSAGEAFSENPQLEQLIKDAPVTKVETCGINGANHALTITEKDIQDVEKVTELIDKEFELKEEQ